MSMSRRPSYRKKSSSYAAYAAAKYGRKNSFYGSRSSRYSRAPRKSSKISLYLDKPGAEWKSIESNFTGLALPATPVFTGAALLNAITQGNGANQRNGRKINMSSLMYRVRVNGVAGAGNNLLFRVLIVYDKQTNFATPLNTDALAPVDFTGLMNLTNSERFLIVSDKIYEAQGGGGQLEGHCFVKFGLPTIYVGSTADVTSIATGGLFMFVCSNQTAAGSTMDGNLRVRYTDS